MTERTLPKLNKIPFLLADVLLLLLGSWIVFKQPHPLGTGPLLLLVGCVAAGAWFLATPFLAEYRALVKFAEADSLNNTVEQIENLHAIGEQIARATSQWQTVQEHSSTTVSAAREIAGQIGAEARQFTDFLHKANDTEKAHLRLEVEKLRRGEGEWLQLVVHLLDHVFALHQAAWRSGQPKLREQMAHFQNACRDAVRRVGLIPFEAAPGEPFDGLRHQLIEADAQAPSDAIIDATLATGFTYQGQLIRRSLVSLRGSEAPLAGAKPDSAQANGDSAPAAAATQSESAARGRDVEDPSPLTFGGT